MNIGMVGLGKLGLPVATAMAARGLDVYGYDPHVWQYPADLSYEQGLEEVAKDARGRMHFCGLNEVIQNCDVIMVAVQTPHEPRFEGVTPLPEDRADFDYSFLRRAVAQTGGEAALQGRQVTLAIISTVLPGTMEREIRPLLGSHAKLVYNPSFIAMGTTIRDFIDPEFVLLGGDEDDRVADVYRKLRPFMPFYRTTIENAELIKVAYNTFIGLKVAFANTLMEVCHKAGCDVEAVTGALKKAHRRLISPAYMDGGMGDGGGCHPRDNIALSWLARELDLSHDLFEDVMACREDQARWLADLVLEHQRRTGLPVGILGIAYKPGSHITTGSPARLVKAMLKECPNSVSTYDPHVGIGTEETRGSAGPMVWLVGCKHHEFPDLKFPTGSVVIDPFRYMPDQDGVTVVRIGEWAPGRTATSRSTSQAQAA